MIILYIIKIFNIFNYIGNYKTVLIIFKYFVSLFPGSEVVLLSKDKQDVLIPRAVYMVMVMMMKTMMIDDEDEDGGGGDDDDDDEDDDDDDDGDDDDDDDDDDD